MRICIACHDRKYPSCYCGKSFIHVCRCRGCRKELPCADCRDCRPKPKAVYFTTKDYSFLHALETPFPLIKGNYPKIEGEFWLELDVNSYCRGRLVLKKNPRLHIPTMTIGTVRELH